ncbi:Coenzyme F420 hydrogenase/dehydrogenase, beta subunit C-terminal domain [Acuticoccus sp.]|uniref:Coenzyme F420 hydrogenase/dehydrogenase, beta subunit C-terminal domain n=1 Tax=Acuticoccus sp. TaxID=1904378 RepID=UPI003B51EA73
MTLLQTDTPDDEAGARSRVAGLGSPTVSTVLRGKLCSGCGGCAAIAPAAIAMAPSPDGFLRPRVHGSVDAAQEAQIARACPGNVLTLDARGRPDDPLWGPIVALRTGHAADPALRRHASSGGALSAIVTHLLQRGVVDAVLQTAADPDHALGNVTVISSGGEEVHAAAGSRYAPSTPLAGLGDRLASLGKVAFVGKPCDVAALQSLRANDPRLAAQVPVTISFFCAGVPSERAARRVLEHLGIDGRDVASFRYRGDGWPGHARAQLKDGTVRQMTYAQSWGGILSKDVQLRCKICPDGTGGFADIVCADAWETDDAGYPLFEEAEGVSLVVSRTALGEDLVRDALAAGTLIARPVDVCSIAPMQPGQVRKRRATLARLAGLRACLRPVPQYRGFHLATNARRAGALANAKEFLATVRRVVRGRL